MLIALFACSHDTPLPDIPSSALREFCESASDAERDALVWSYGGEVPETCWVQDMPCTTVEFGDVRCPGAYARVGLLVCSQLDEEEAACVAASVVDCTFRAPDDVGECFGLQPGGI